MQDVRRQRNRTGIYDRNGRRSALRGDNISSESDADQTVSHQVVRLSEGGYSTVSQSHHEGKQLEENSHAHSTELKRQNRNPESLYPRESLQDPAYAHSPSTAVAFGRALTPTPKRVPRPRTSPIANMSLTPSSAQSNSKEARKRSSERVKEVRRREYLALLEESRQAVLTRDRLVAVDMRASISRIRASGGFSPSDKQAGMGMGYCGEEEKKVLGQGYSQQGVRRSSSAFVNPGRRASSSPRPSIYSNRSGSTIHSTPVRAQTPKERRDNVSGRSLVDDEGRRRAAERIRQHRLDEIKKQDKLSYERRMKELSKWKSRDEKISAFLEKQARSALESKALESKAYVSPNVHSADNSAQQNRAREDELLFCHESVLLGCSESTNNDTSMHEAERDFSNGDTDSFGCTRSSNNSSTSVLQSVPISAVRSSFCTPGANLYADAANTDRPYRPWDVDSPWVDGAENELHPRRAKCDVSNAGPSKVEQLGIPPSDPRHMAIAGVHARTAVHAPLPHGNSPRMSHLSDVTQGGTSTISHAALAVRQSSVGAVTSLEQHGEKENFAYDFGVGSAVSGLGYGFTANGADIELSSKYDRRKINQNNSRSQGVRGSPLEKNSSSPVTVSANMSPVPPMSTDVSLYYRCLATPESSNVSKDMICIRIHRIENLREMPLGDTNPFVVVDWGKLGRSQTQAVYKSLQPEFSAILRF